MHLLVFIHCNTFCTAATAAGWYLHAGSPLSCVPQMRHCRFTRGALHRSLDTRQAMIQQLTKNVCYSFCLMHFHVMLFEAILVAFLHPVLQSTELNRTALYGYTHSSTISFPLLTETFLHCAPNTRRSWKKRSVWSLKPQK